ncbi:MAG TPA: OmpH family outer membrane protein, partial [Parvularculaceae bacterium]|nr:OmpH family outer membrane protein [Parvularculaceae bacterium]
MSLRFQTIAGAALLLAGGLAVGAIATGAEAQQAAKAPVILIVDQSTILSQSDAGKTIPTQVQSIQSGVQKEFDAEAAKLKKDIENFEKGSSLMSEEVRNKTGQELAMRQQVQLPQQAQIMEQVLGNVVQVAQAKILQESQPIMKSIIDKRGATLLLDRSAVMYAAPDSDITQEVLAELNKKMKTVEVQKVTLAEVKKKAAEAAAKQQA